MSTALAEQPALERKKTQGSSDIDEKRGPSPSHARTGEGEAFDGHDV